jgi:hypothetical protein
MGARYCTGPFFFDTRVCIQTRVWPAEYHATVCKRSLPTLRLDVHEAVLLTGWIPKRFFAI